MRRSHDDYQTHAKLLAPLLELEAWNGGPLIHGSVLEPAAGEGQLASGLQAVASRVYTNDILPEYDCDYHVDASKLRRWFDTFPSSVDWVVTNPPYTTRVLEGILEASLSYANLGVAMLLRLSAMEPVVNRSERGRMLQAYADNMRYLITFSDPRPRYDPTKRGTDSVTTAWFVWEKAWSWKQNGMQSPFQFITGWLK